MNRSDYLRLIAEIIDRWPNGEWSDAMIDTWWAQFEPLDIEHCVRGVVRLQSEGHGPFTPDPGLVLRYARAASPGGGTRRVGAHAEALREMASTAASREESMAAISACRRLLAGDDPDAASDAAQTGAQAP